MQLGNPSRIDVSIASGLGVLAVSASEECSYHGGGSCAGPVLMLGGVGAAVGLGIDALIKGRKIIYKAPTPPDVQVSIMPVITDRVRGCAFVVRF